MHQMERNYHEPEPFRYAFNSFARAAKEVPQIVLMEIQRVPHAKPKVDTLLMELTNNDFFKVLGKRRDFIVHQGMLSLQSHGQIGTTEGSKIKFTFPFPVQPWETSDEAYERYKDACRSDKLWRGLGPDCDSAPALWRTWMIPQFPKRDLLDVAFDAWSLVGKLLSDVVEAIGGEALDLSMPCRHNPASVRIKRYSQQEFFLSVDGIDLQEEERKYREASAQKQPGK
ncbi:hypothetical protein PP715_13960 [Ralstonia solanacearum]|uniref:hypothetical protein n=1 Tax=Ralstonia solanacearum TaxID=305 RepID=UPI0011AE5E14|nr:hypothetical protein [Ralstonia solanacearum]MBB6588048.1 hypothetical protein [Ralstonia solanacearum]MCL9840970.1 hypothetical protein [Ralstonia solanacearum]MDB0533536.1 hypothetical protein [Ralstonia solanacearum]MDB0538238.1 hypothetical protein [Ralstonia solanacearum]MDB0548146.1 hypothetical protein [Ralstonia solanacearum]